MNCATPSAFSERSISGHARAGARHPLRPECRRRSRRPGSPCPGAVGDAFDPREPRSGLISCSGRNSLPGSHQRWASAENAGELRRVGIRDKGSRCVVASIRETMASLCCPGARQCAQQSPFVLVDGREPAVRHDSSSARLQTVRTRTRAVGGVHEVLKRGRAPRAGWPRPAGSTATRSGVLARQQRPRDVGSVRPRRAGAVSAWPFAAPWRLASAAASPVVTLCETGCREPHFGEGSERRLARRWRRRCRAPR